jgi:hypothetical protein
MQKFREVQQLQVDLAKAAIERDQVVQASLSELLVAVEKAKRREDEPRAQMTLARASLGRLEESVDRIHDLVAPVIGAPKPRRPPRDWDAVQQTNLDQFEEKPDGPVR